MIDSLAPNPAAAPTTGTSTAPIGPEAVPASDAERFRQLMNAPATPTSASELGRPLATGSGVASPSLGQTLVGTMQDLSADTRARFARAEAVLSKPDLTMSDLLSLQFTLLQTSVQFEIASKGISKLTQNIDSVLKTQ